MSVYEPSPQVAEHASDLAQFVVASPSSFHAAAEVARRLTEAGFIAQDESAAWSASPGGHYLVRDGAAIAWWVPTDADATTPFRVLGAHTDSPSFKLKPQPVVRSAGWQQVGVEVYGGPLINSWLDRDLGLAGRVCAIDGAQHLIKTGAVMRIPQLAIHLDRQVNDAGLQLDKQRHTAPIWSVVDAGLVPDVLSHIAQLARLSVTEVGGYDLLAFDTQQPAVIGSAGEFLAAGRLDNLSSVHAGLQALIAAATDGGAAIMVLAAFDHEEIGSGSRSGAAGPILEDVMRRTTTALGGGVDEYARAIAASYCLSADAGHGVHPNYPERHDPVNQPILGGGPLLKINANQRYSTDAPGSALWRRCCAAAGVPTQEFVSNNQLPCGSTIGPITATRTGMRTIDVGVPLLSMHSVRVMCGLADPYALARATTEFFRS
ncbi:MAG: M18 family aminopeptidase [Antricoccus sp.]